jgi:hypothetical protein
MTHFAPAVAEIHRQFPVLGQIPGGYGEGVRSSYGLAKGTGLPNVRPSNSMTLRGETCFYHRLVLPLAGDLGRIEKLAVVIALPG